MKISAPPERVHPAERNNMAVCQTVTYKVADKCDLKADVYVPEGSDAAPVILWIHGGALIGGNRKDIRGEQLEFYLRNGFALVSIDYRLAPETKLPQIIADIRDAYDWLHREGRPRFGFDSRRIVVAGHSAGGYLTLMTGFCVSPRPQALVSFYGYGDLIGGWYSRPDPFYCKLAPVEKDAAYASIGTEPVADLSLPGTSPDPRGRFQFYLYCRQHDLWPKEVSGFDPDSESKQYVPFNPLWNVTPDYPPTLLLHGDLDTDVPYAQSVLMAYEMQRHGVEHELHTVRGGGHGFDGHGFGKPEVDAAFDRVLGFLKQRL